MKLRSLALFVFLLSAHAQDFQIAQPGYHFAFPRDYFSHPSYQTEWWYYTGNLHAANGHRYGFELTFFRQAQQIAPQAARLEDSVWRPDQIYLAHLALSDIDGKHFYHTERLNRAGPGIAGADAKDNAYWNGNWQVKWISFDPSRQQLIAVCDRFTINLTLASAKPPVIHGQNGISRKGPDRGQASHYVSLTRLEASGHIKLRNSTQSVIGLAWMDHEFFTEPKGSDLAGWDWFSIQLNNGEELMLYRLRTKSGAPDLYSSATYIDSQGKASFLPAGTFSLTPGAGWRSPHSHSRYPIAWRIQVPSLQIDLTETTSLPDQELADPNGITPSYWEGAVQFQGLAHAQPVNGVGYLEMTGYAGPIQLSGMTGR